VLFSSVNYNRRRENPVSMSALAHEKTVEVPIPSVSVAPEDALFVLYVLDRAGYVHGNPKLQKIGFFSQLALLVSNLRWPSFRFYRWKHGPFSLEYQAAFQELRRRGFVLPAAHGCSEHGEFVLGVAIPALRAIPENEAIFRVTDAALAKCRRKNGEQLRTESYGVQWVLGSDRKTAMMADLPHGTNLIVPSDEQAALSVPKWVQDFVAEALTTSGSAYEEAKRRLPEFELDALANLREAYGDCPEPASA